VAATVSTPSIFWIERVSILMMRPLACPNEIGVPALTASLPSAPIFYSASLLQTEGVFPTTCAC
jgi:hypothetical protein